MQAMTGSWDSASGQPYVSAGSPQRPPPHPVAPGPDQVLGAQPNSGAPASRPSNGLGVASLLIGLAALVASLTVVGGLMLGVLAAILGLIARVQVKHGQASNGDVAITGVVLGVLAIVASMIIALFWVVPQMRIINSEARITSIASVTNRETSKLASDIAGTATAWTRPAAQQEARR